MFKKIIDRLKYLFDPMYKEYSDKITIEEANEIRDIINAGYEREAAAEKKALEDNPTPES